MTQRETTTKLRHAGRIGAMIIVSFGLIGAIVAVYVFTMTWDPSTPTWARVVGLVFPLFAAPVFVWYLWLSRGRDYRSSLYAYAGLGSVLGGLAFLTPGLGLTVQQTAIGQSMLNVEVILAELWLGGGMIGLATGHFYGTVQAERIRLKRRETELEESRRQLTVLNRVLRHDIRNQMNLIIGQVAQLPQDENDTSLEDVNQTVQKVLEISENARDIESVIRGEGPPPEPTELVPVVEDAVNQVRSRFPEATFEIGDLEAVTVLSNGNLESAVRNLVENAVEHNDADTPIVEVTVSVTEEDWVELRVSDNGPGIPETERAVLDQGQETQLEHSSGLGLWLVQWITRDIGGELRLGNRKPRGTCVTMRLPQASADTASPDP